MKEIIKDQSLKYIQDMLENDIQVKIVSQDQEIEKRVILQVIDKDESKKESEPKRSFYYFGGEPQELGSFAVIHKVYPVDPNSGEMSSDFKIVKIIPKTLLKESEYKIAQNFIEMQKPVFSDNHVFLIQENLGLPLDTHPEVPKLSPENLLELIKTIVLRQNEMHHVRLKYSNNVHTGKVDISSSGSLSRY